VKGGFQTSQKERLRQIAKHDEEIQQLANMCDSQIQRLIRQGNYSNQRKHHDNSANTRIERLHVVAFTDTIQKSITSVIQGTD
jgi:hypothetical protein